MSDVIVDRQFADKFLTAVDDPFAYHVYFLFHDWWAEAPQSAIDAYEQELRSLPGVEAVLAERFLAEPLTIDDVAGCAPGTLGAAYHDFIVDNDLMENLGKNYREFNEQLTANGALDRMPDDLSFMMVRGFQIHDMLHSMTGFSPSPLGELAQAGFHFAQMRVPYHAFRFAVTMGHLAFVKPEHTMAAMDAMTTGWQLGRSCENLHFHRWEDELDTALADLRARFGIDPSRYQHF